MYLKHAYLTAPTDQWISSVTTYLWLSTLGIESASINGAILLDKYGEEMLPLLINGTQPEHA